MTIVDEHRPAIAVAPACRALKISRATWYRRRNSTTEPAAAHRCRHPRRLPDRQREQVVAVLCSQEFLDRSPRAIYAALLDRGEYLCSIRTMYRILTERRAVRERQAQGRTRRMPFPSAAPQDPTSCGPGTSPSSPDRAAAGSTSTSSSTSTAGSQSAGCWLATSPPSSPRGSSSSPSRSTRSIHRD